ncbi:autoinducer 2 import system permease LsrD [Salmonella enterica subsp. enterica serovar Heidelberg str. 76-0300]|nr:autoinducer 2 import system permease LsrD [Salmonella enterica subsp. enterica serovar Heidelberg str. 76-0300]
MGRNVFLIGQSARVAQYSAIPVNRTLYTVYAMTGCASAIAAVLLVSYFGSARSDLGASFLMPAITAVVLGGANIYGGSGSIMGVRVGGAAGGIFTAGATDGRSAESNFQRIVRCASHCCCRWSFRQFASSPNP